MYQEGLPIKAYEQELAAPVHGLHPAAYQPVLKGLGGLPPQHPGLAGASGSDTASGQDILEDPPYGLDLR
jgi:hypothetical protein